MLNAAADNHNHMIGFNYDAAGNLTREGSGTPSWNYSWDAENRLSSISGSAADTFTYDGDGERVKKSNGALFWREHGGPYLTKTNLAGGIISERIFFNGLHVAILNPPTTVHYLFQDHLGGEHLVTDATGSSNCQDIDTLPFGSEVGYSTSCNSSYRFAGMDRDYEDSAKLDYAIDRYYDLRLGRFLSPDEFTGGPVDAYSTNDPLPPGPLPYADISNPQSLNKYTYTYDNPLRYVDPNGHLVVLAGTSPDQEDERKRLTRNASKKGEAALFKTVVDKNGKTNLVIDKSAAANFQGKHSAGYNMLAGAIAAKNTITVQMSNFDSVTSPADAKGNVTVNLNRNESPIDRYSQLRGLEGQKISNPFNIIAGHEVLGHAYPRIMGWDSSERNAREVENVLRQEQGLDLRDPSSN